MGEKTTAMGTGFVESRFSFGNENDGISHPPESQLVSVIVCRKIACPFRTCVSTLERLRISKCCNESSTKKDGTWVFEKVASSVSCNGCPMSIDVLSSDAATVPFCDAACRHKKRKRNESGYGFFMDQLRLIKNRCNTFT